MNRFRERRPCGLAGTLLLGMLILIHASLPASARPWKPTPQALALDYAEIIHQRGTRDLVIIIWLVPQMLGIASEEARELLDQYALIGALHGHMLIGGTMSYDANSQLQAADDRGDALIPVTGDSVPPTVQGALTTWQGVLKKMIGPMGEGVQWFVFEAGRVHSCEKGGLSISFEGETYTYETPVPGCPVN